MNVETTRNFVKAHNVLAEFIEHPSADGLTSEGAATAAGVPLSLVIKALCFVEGKKKCFVIIQGNKKVDTKKIPGLKKPRLATPSELSGWFDAEPGGIPPVGLPADVPKIVDEGILSQQFVVGSAGSRFVGLKISPKTIAEQPNTTILDVSL